jgi:tRNA(Arg) A34 adenosine deaminase TadA
MNLYEKFSADLHEVANKSSMKYPIASALIHNKRMITHPHNNSDRSSFHGAIHLSLHSEMSTILEYYSDAIQWDRSKNKWCLDSEKEKKKKRGKPAGKKVDIIVIRSCNSNGISLARPCHLCLQMMKAVNIRYCYYSTNERTIIREKVENMISIQISNIAKREMKRVRVGKCVAFPNLLNYISGKTSTKMVYYESIMKEMITGCINKLALDYFIQYNFSTLFPCGYYIVTKNQIKFYNNMHHIIAECSIIV